MLLGMNTSKKKKYVWETGAIRSIDTEKNRRKRRRNKVVCYQLLIFQYTLLQHNSFFFFFLSSIVWGGILFLFLTISTIHAYISWSQKFVKLFLTDTLKIYCFYWKKTDLNGERVEWKREKANLFGGIFFRKILTFEFFLPIRIRILMKYAHILCYYDMCSSVVPSLYATCVHLLVVHSGHSFSFLIVYSLLFKLKYYICCVIFIKRPIST